MIVTYFQCLTLRVRSGHLSNALTRERSWLTEKLVSPPYQSQSVVDSFTNYKKYPPVTPLWANSTTVRRPLDKMKPKDWFRLFSFLFYFIIFSFFFGLKLRGTRHLATRLQKPSSDPTLGQQYNCVRRPLGKMKPKDWFRQFFILFSDSSCEEQDIWLHGYKIPSSDPTSG